MESDSTLREQIAIQAEQIANLERWIAGNQTNSDEKKAILQYLGLKDRERQLVSIVDQLNEKINELGETNRKLQSEVAHLSIELKDAKQDIVKSIVKLSTYDLAYGIRNLATMLERTAKEDEKKLLELQHDDLLQKGRIEKLEAKLRAVQEVVSASQNTASIECNGC